MLPHFLLSRFFASTLQLFDLSAFQLDRTPIICGRKALAVASPIIPIHLPKLPRLQIPSFDSFRQARRKQRLLIRMEVKLNRL